MEIYTRDVGATGLVVLDELAEAIQDANHWPQFLKSVIAATGASRGALVALSPRPKGRLWIADGISDLASEQWHSYFRYIDPRFEATQMPARGECCVYRGEDLVADEALAQTEFYRDYAAPNQMRWVRSVWIRPDAAHASIYGLHVYRGVDEGNFEANAYDLLELTARRLRTHEQIGVANALSRAAGLGDEQGAVFLLNAYGGLVLCNQKASDLIEAGAVVDNGKSLAFGNHNASAWLSALISADGLASNAFGTVARQRESLPGVGSVQFALHPFEQIGSTLSLASARFALTLKPAEARAAPDLARAAYQMYRWTGAELDTVRRLSAGDELPNIAEARDCSVETVRSHLKNAKRKAGVKRQVDLVRLMLALEG